MTSAAFAAWATSYAIPCHCKPDPLKHFNRTPVKGNHNYDINDALLLCTQRKGFLMVGEEEIVQSKREKVLVQKVMEPPLRNSRLEGTFGDHKIMAICGV